MRGAGTGALIGAALAGVVLTATAAFGGTGGTDRAAAPPPPGPAPALDGKFRTTLRIKSGGKPFGQKKGDVVTRNWSFKERCGDVSPCDRVKLMRKGKSGRFGSMLRRQGRASWRGVEKVRGRCGDGLKFRSKAVIEVDGVDYADGEVTEFTGSFNARVKGCVKGRERAAVRGKLR